MAKQHCLQLRKILSIIDPKGCLSSLFKKSLIRDKFLTDHVEKQYQPDTVKAHLLSLRNFYFFVLIEDPECIQVDPAIVQKFVEKARLWSSSYRRTATAVTYKNRVKILRSKSRQTWCPCLKIVIQLGKQLLT